MFSVPIQLVGLWETTILSGVFLIVRKYCTECTVTVITCLVVAKELFILCALFIPSSHHSSFSVSFMPCSYCHWSVMGI